MFDKNRFSEILKNINDTYSSQRNFAKESGINRTYISQYINLKLAFPPKPDMLKKIATSSKGLISYEELMNICGYVDYSTNSNIKENLYQEFEKVINLHNFYAEELDIIKNYLLADPNDPDFSAYFNQFQNMLNYLEEDQKKFLLDFSTDFLLLLSKKIANPSINISLESNRNVNLLDSNFSVKHSLASPVYSRIFAEKSDLEQGYLEGYLSIAPNLFGIEKAEDCFFLRMQDESMSKLVKNGGYALVRRQDFAQNGDIALVSINNSDAILRKFSVQNNLTLLEPMSYEPTFTTLVYGIDSDIKILGIYIGKFEVNK